MMNMGAERRKAMLILSFSGAGADSQTLKCLEVLEHCKEVGGFIKVVITPEFNFEKEFADVAQKMFEADAIIWAVSPYSMMIPAHMLKFFEACRFMNIRLYCINTYFTTNLRAGDTFMTAVLERQIRSIASQFVQGLSMAASDMLNPKMALYDIAPTPTEKHKKPKKAEKFHRGEGLDTAVQWYQNIRNLAGAYKGKTNITFNTPKTVLFVDMDEFENHTDFVLNAVRHFEQFYTISGCTVKKIALRNYQVHDCNGCGACLSTKRCLYIDDYALYEEELRRADVIIFYGSCICGMTSSLSKRMIDRSLKNGMMPMSSTPVGEPVTPAKYQSVGYILDCDAESYAVFNEYAFASASIAQQHYIGCMVNLPNHTAEDWITAELYSLLVLKNGMLPQRNFYSEKIGAHYAELARRFPNMLPREAKYFSQLAAPVKPDTSKKPVTHENYRQRVQARQLPFLQQIEAVDKDALINA